MVLRKIFGPMRDEVKGVWRKLRNEKFHNLYSLLSIIRMIKSRKMRWGEKKNSYRVLVRKSEGKRPLGRPRRRLVDNITMDLREIGWYGTGWNDLIQDRD
jgi:hypothetical protein